MNPVGCQLAQLLKTFGSHIRYLNWVHLALYVGSSWLPTYKIWNDRKTQKLTNFEPQKELICLNSLLSNSKDCCHQVVLQLLFFLFAGPISLWSPTSWKLAFNFSERLLLYADTRVSFKAFWSSFGSPETTPTH